MQQTKSTLQLSLGSRDLTSLLFAEGSEGILVELSHRVKFIEEYVARKLQAGQTRKHLHVVFTHNVT